MNPEQNPENWQQPDAPAVDEYHPVVDSATPEVVDAENEIEQPALAVTPEGDEDLIRWTAPAYIHREQQPVWYTILALVTLVLIALAVFVMKSWTFALLVPVMAAALVVYTRRPPVEFQYTLSRKGLHINDVLHSYDEYKAFSVVLQHDHNTIALIPRKRFSLGETIHFPDEAGEAIVDLLAARLPMQEGRRDLFDQIISRLGL